MKPTNKSERTRQVQFRMDPNKLKALRMAIIEDENMHSMADLFNKAVDDYLKSRSHCKQNGPSGELYRQHMFYNIMQRNTSISPLSEDGNIIKIG